MIGLFFFCEVPAAGGDAGGEIGRDWRLCVGLGGAVDVGFGVGGLGG